MQGVTDILQDKTLAAKSIAMQRSDGYVLFEDLLPIFQAVGNVASDTSHAESVVDHLFVEMFVSFKVSR